jgi:hypothetical protein
MPDPANTFEGAPLAGGPEPRDPPEAEAVPPSDDSLYPYPEILADWQWLFSEVATKQFDPYRGHFVAVFEKKILGGGDDEPQLRQAIAAQHNLDPDRLVIMFVEGLDPLDTEISPWPALR